MNTDNPFYRPETPKNSLELIRWAIFEPNRLEKFSSTLSRKASVIWFLKTCPWIIILTITLYFFFSAIIVALDLPVCVPGEFKSDITEKWIIGNFLSNFLLLINLTYYSMAFYLGLCLIIAFTIALIANLTNVLAVGLGLGLVVGLLAGLIEVMVKALTKNMIAVLAYGLTAGLIGRIAIAVTYNFTGIFKIVIFYCSFFRIIFYPYYFIEVLLFSRNNLTQNPFLKDALIWFSLPNLVPKLLEDSWNYPQIAIQFSVFLFEHRPLQKKLAFRIIHKATAATWYYYPLWAEALIEPIEMNGYHIEFEKYFPSSNWFRQLETVKSQLIQAEKQNHKGFKKDAWQNFHASLKTFEQITLTQSDIWKADYLKAIRKWQEESQKQMKQMEEELKFLEPVTRNIYRAGEALRPNEYGQQTFVGREDLRDELSFRILSSGIMPTFLLQGQRRVGKTSLVNFLPELLGPRFLILSQDMQSDEFQSVSDCLKGFIRKARFELKFENTPLSLLRGDSKVEKPFENTPLPLSRGDSKMEKTPENLLDCWREFRTFFENTAQQQERKIILAWDEYENFHRLLQKQGENGQRLLEAMRSFSQHQNQVVFLFTGLSLFADLGEPDFSRYFVHAHRLKVDYLKKEAAEKLITRPYEEFNLIYPSDVVEKIWQLTCGHPALLQHICSEMVNIANMQNRKEMTQSDLETVCREKILDRGNAVMTTFWKDFCTGTLKNTVMEILHTQTSANRSDVLRLLDYGFIQEPEPGKYRLRVPLFAQWIARFGESFPGKV